MQTPLIRDYLNDTQMKTRKELLNDYKNKRFPIGVFQIRNTVNGKILVDWSVNLEKIWNRHRTELEFGGHRNPRLQQDWNEFGKEAFVFEILAEVKRSDEGADEQFVKEAKELAKMYIDELQPFNERGYNQTVQRQ